MSAQGLNSTAYSGFRFTVPVGGSPGAGTGSGFPTQASSDYTKRLKQQALYREFAGKALSTGSTTPYNNPYTVPVDYTIAQSNANRLSYEFGRVDCTVCLGPLPDSPLGS